MNSTPSAALAAHEHRPMPAEPINPAKELVKFKLFSSTELLAGGKIIPAVEFFFRAPGAPADEMPKYYKFFLGKEVNEAPREVFEHIQKLAYDQYEQHEDPRTKDVYLVKSGSETRFEVAAVAN